MKGLSGCLLIILFAALFSSCNKVNSPDENKDPNVIGGDTNIPLVQVGNTASTGSVYIGNNYYDINSSFEIIKNENGFVTIKTSADLSKIPALQAFNNLIPSEMKDTSGKINTEIKLKITSEGIQDLFNKDKKLHTIVKYDCNVGDQYKLTKSDGVTITRTVTSKSTTDDTPYGFMYIKAITVEQDSRVPGIKKFIYKVNHKFGLVYFAIVAEDGSTASTYIYPANY